MSLTGDAVKEMKESFRVPIEVGGHVYAPNDWKLADKPTTAPAPLKVWTLQAVVDYLKTNELNENGGAATTDLRIVHVVNPSTVEVVGALEDEIVDFRRKMYLQGFAGNPKIPFGDWMDPETFVVALQTQFEKTEERDNLLLLVAGIESNEVRTTFDDGMAQEVKVAAGIRLVGNQKIPSPIVLKPFRSFIEIDQVETPFVIRARSGPNGVPVLAIIEADGGKWKLDAVKRIAEWLREKLPEGKIIA